MSRLTSALLLGGAVVLASYVSAPAAPTAAPEILLPEEISAIDAAVPLANEVAQETGRLRERLSVVPPQPVVKRDPFGFGVVRKLPPPASPETIATPMPVENMPVAVVAWPTLVALLTDGAGSGTLTAVLAIGDSVEMLKAGQTIGGFLIREVTPTSVEVVHVASAVVTRLALR